MRLSQMSRVTESAADYVIQLLLQILTIKIAPYEKILFYYA